MENDGFWRFHGNAPPPSPEAPGFVGRGGHWAGSDGLLQKSKSCHGWTRM